jgi:hypothetical protein
MDKDDIAWFIDILGTTKLLAAVAGCEVVVYKRGVTPPNDGLFFKIGHWYCLKNNASSDSYSAGYQLKGSAHFCQTFAVMLYLGTTQKLVKDKYADNIKLAIDFWIAKLENEAGIANTILEEIHTSEYVDDSIALKAKEVKLLTLTKQQLIEFLLMVKSHAQTFVNAG